MLCLPLPQPGQIVPWLPSCCPSPLGLSPPNPTSGEQSRGPSALDRKLSAPLARKAGSLTAGKAGCLPQPCSLKPNSFFQLQHERAPGPAFPGDPAACRSHGQGIFSEQCSKPAEPLEQRPGKDSNHLPLSLHPPIRAEETQRTETILPGEACALGSSPWRSQAQVSLEQSPILPALFPQGGNTSMGP